MAPEPRSRGLHLAIALLLSACSVAPTPVPSAAPTPVPSAASLTAGATNARASSGAESARGGGASATPDLPVASRTPDGSDHQPTPPTASPVSNGGASLPECAYLDKPAAGNADKDWATMVLDTIYRLPADFVPRRLVSTSEAGMQKGFEVIPAVVDALRDMHEASMDDDAEIAIRWAYRGYAEQQGAFGFWVRESGEAAALKKSARPGHSEHQLGTAIDFRGADSLLAPWDYDDWAETDAGAWMKQNAWRFGFILSYPKGKQAATCYAYEPWHYRYVGRDLAQEVHESGAPLRQFLWEQAHPTG